MMNKTHTVSAFVFLLFVSVNTVQCLEKLHVNELLAYKIIDNKLRIYAQEDLDQKKLRLLGEWDNVDEWGGLQFADNRRKCFFVIEPPNSGFRSLYVLDGNSGTVRYLFDVSYPFRVSYDGNYIIFNALSKYPDIALYSGGGLFMLWEVKSNKLINLFSWKVKENRGGSFNFRRNNANSFMNIYYVVEGSFILAHATIDIESQKLTVVWDKTEDAQAIVPYLTDDNYHDDVVNQWKDNSLRLNTLGE